MTTLTTPREIVNPAPPLIPKLLTKWRKLLKIFHDNHERLFGDLLTPTQIQIIDIIAKRRYPRTQLILPTQYGKSLAVALGVLLRVTHYNEKWAIVAPTEDKARIIMDYIIEHIFDDELFEEQLEYSGGKERLKQERSKSRLTFREGGEVRIYTADARNTKSVKKALMGFGAANVILDESGLISDDLYSTVKRMVGGAIDTKTGEEGFILEIGNPFYRNHFFRTWNGTRYKKIFVDVYMALAEGRFSQDFVDEMREEAMFDVLYECKFPDAEEILAGGYRRLISDEALEKTYIEALPALKYKLDENEERLKNKWGFDIVDDTPILGIDPAGTGSNKTAFTLRLPKHGVAMVLARMDEEDPTVQADKAERFIKEWTVTDYMIAVDAGGIGHGLAYVLEERGYLVKKIQFGETKEGGKKISKGFKNIKAQLFWLARTWLRSEGGKLVKDTGFDEMKLINYKTTSSLKVQIEPKQDMINRKAKEGESVESPDTADSFALTFVDTSTIVGEDDIDFD